MVNLHQIKSTWFAKLEYKELTCLVACNYNLPRPENQNPTYKQRPNKGNSISRLPLKLMACTPENGNLILENVFFTNNDQNEPSPLNPRELTIKADNTNAETWSTVGATREKSHEIFPPNRQMM